MQMCFIVMRRYSKHTCCRLSLENGNKVETWNIISWPSYNVYTEFFPVMSPVMQMKQKIKNPFDIFCITNGFYYMRNCNALWKRKLIPLTSRPPRNRSHPFNVICSPSTPRKSSKSALPHSANKRKTYIELSCIYYW